MKWLLLGVAAFVALPFVRYGFALLLTDDPDVNRTIGVLVGGSPLLVGVALWLPIVLRRHPDPETLRPSERRALKRRLRRLRERDPARLRLGYGLLAALGAVYVLSPALYRRTSASSEEAFRVYAPGYLTGLAIGAAASCLGGLVAYAVLRIRQRERPRAR